MKKIILTMVFLFVGISAYAAVRPMFQDIKLPTQQILEKQTFTNPAAAGTNQVLNANAGPTSAAVTTVTTFAAQPDVARNLVVTPGGTTGDVEATTITVNGTDINNNVILETFSFAADASTAKTGNRAFKTVTSVVYPANAESGGFAATWSIGYGEKLGLKRCMDSAGHFVLSTFNSNYEGTRPALTASITSVSDNTVDFPSAMNTANDFEAFFFQNFRCVR